MAEGETGATAAIAPAPRMMNDHCVQADCLCQCISCVWRAEHHGDGLPVVRYYMAEDRKAGLVPRCQWKKEGSDVCDYETSAGTVNDVPMCGICMSAEIMPPKPVSESYQMYKPRFYEKPKAKWTVLSTTIVATKPEPIEKQGPAQTKLPEA